jgi:phage terminase large subunit GpA-like protein
MSRISTAYRESDMGEPWVPCYRCGRLQVMRWAQVRWDKGQPSSAWYQCEFCPGQWTDTKRNAACERAVWVPRHPGGNCAGFWLSPLYAPWKKLGDIAIQFYKVRHHPERHKTFVNTVLAEEW